MQLQLLDCGDAAEQRRAAAGDNAFLDSRAGGVHSIFDTGLLFLQFGFGGCADFDDGDAADQLGKALLELFLVVIAGGVFDLRADLLHTAFDVLSDDQEGLAHLGGLLEQREQVLHGADFLFVNEDAHVLEHAFHAFGVGDEVGGEVAAVKLHAFDYFEGGFHRLGFLDGDDALLADLLHGFGDDAAALLVVVGGNGANLGDPVALDVLVELLDFFHGDFDGLLDSALESGGAGACGDSLDAFAEDSLREHGRGGRAVTSNIGSLGSDFADHLRAHVLEWIAEFDFLGYGHAVLGNDRRAELLFDHRVAALGTERDLHCVGKGIHAAQNRLAGILTCNNLLRHTGHSS